LSKKMNALPSARRWLVTTGEPDHMQ
jgi:hypothetical protein